LKAVDDANFLKKELIELFERYSLLGLTPRKFETSLAYKHSYGEIE